VAGESSELLDVLVIDCTFKLDEFDSLVNIAIMIIDESLATAWNSLKVSNNFVIEKFVNDLFLGTSAEIDVKLEVRNTRCSIGPSMREAVRESSLSFGHLLLKISNLFFLLLLTSLSGGLICQSC
jgi:hypothetical protein